MGNENDSNEKNKISSEKKQTDLEKEKYSENINIKKEEIKPDKIEDKKEEVKLNESKDKKEEEIKLNESKDKKEEIKLNESKDKKEEKEEKEAKEIIIPNITVKIKLERGNYWQKEYNKETELNTIASEFKKANNLEKIKRNHYLEFIYNNTPLQMDSRALNIIITEEQNEIILDQEIKPIPGIESIEKIEPVDYIGKPISSPFEIYIFEIRKKIISKIKYSKEKERKYQLNKFGINSAYCNGINHLFISGGEDPYSNEIYSLFWDIDLINKSFNEEVQMPIPKKNHKMIYIENKVYIIGGNDEKTMFYDIINHKVNIWRPLNNKKFEPSLIKFYEYLFCIDSSRKYLNDYNFEKINLYEENSEWEIVNPRISPNILNLNFSQKFFGLIEDKNENIIFVGGIYDNNVEKDINKNNYFFLQYNADENIIEKSNMNLENIKYKEINFSEKSFSPIDKNNYIIFPDFTRRAPKVLYFNKERNSLDINVYHSNPKLSKMAKQTRIVSLSNSFQKLNFDMPLQKNKNIYINEKSKFDDDLENSGLPPEYKYYIKIHSKNKNNNVNNNVNNINNNMNINNNYFDKNKNDENIFGNNNIEINNYNNKNENNDENNFNNNFILNKKKSNDIEENINNQTKEKEKEDSNINEINNNNSRRRKISIGSKNSSNNNNFNNVDNKENNNITNEKGEFEKKEVNNINNINNIINNNKDPIKKSINENDNNNKKIYDNIYVNLKNVDNNLNAEEKKEGETEEKKEEKKEEETIEKKEEIKEEEKEEVKEEEKEEEKKEEEKEMINKQSENENNKQKSDISKNGTEMEIFDYYQSYALVSFHSSVNKNINLDRLDNNKVVKNNFKKRNFIQPKEVSVKILKKKRRQFNDYENNEFIDYNNY